MMQQGRVFVIDANRELVDLTEIVLSSEGYDVSTGTYGGGDPRRILAAIKASKADVVCCYLDSERSAVGDLLAQIRADTQTCGISFVVIAASWAILESALSNRTLQVTGGVTVPYSVDDLYDCIDQALRKRAVPVYADA